MNIWLLCAGDVEMYLKYWQAPGRGSKQYDRRSDPGDFRHPGSNRADLTSSINLDKSCDCEYMLYRPGTWFLGVFVNGNHPASFDVRLTKSRCPNDCGGSDRGACDAESGKCTCTKVSNKEHRYIHRLFIIVHFSASSPPSHIERSLRQHILLVQETFTGHDCSETVDKLSLSSAYTSDPRPRFSYDRFELPLGDILSAAPGHSLSLVVEASFNTGGEGSAALPEWVTERPVLLVSGSPGPTMGNATMHIVLQESGVKATLEVESSQVGLVVSQYSAPSSVSRVPSNCVLDGSFWWYQSLH